MESVLKIRRMHQVDGLSVSAIARQLNLSRNTVRKYLHQTLAEPPTYRREQPAKPKLGEFESINKRPLSHVQADAGHDSIDTTSRYLHTTRVERHESAANKPLDHLAGAYK